MWKREINEYNNLIPLAFIIIQTTVYKGLQRERRMQGPNSLNVKSMQGDNKFYVCDSNNRRRQKGGKTILQVHHRYAKMLRESVIIKTGSK